MCLKLPGGRSGLPCTPQSVMTRGSTCCHPDKPQQLLCYSVPLLGKSVDKVLNWEMSSFENLTPPIRACRESRELLIPPPFHRPWEHLFMDEECRPFQQAGYDALQLLLCAKLLFLLYSTMYALCLMFRVCSGECLEANVKCNVYQ